MKKNNLLLIIIAVFFFTLPVLAQDSLHSSNQGMDSIMEELHKVVGKQKKTSYAEAGINYLSNNVYLGRKDSSVLPYLVPILSYYNKSGIYVSASLGYLITSHTTRIDLVTLEGGYRFRAGNYNGQISAGQYFYNAQSTNVTSEINETVSYENGYDLGFIKPTLTGTVSIGSKCDFEGTVGIEHTFYLFDDNLDITPTVSASASTQNYYSSYYRTRRYTIKRKGEAPLPGIKKITGTVENASQFKLLDYELSLPINYKIGQFTLSLIPTYAIPVNPSEVDIQKVLSTGVVKNTRRLENISNTFFIQCGVFYKFPK